MTSVPLSEEIATALSKCFAGGTGPSHRELNELFRNARVLELDPAQDTSESQSKAVRVRAVLGRLADAGPKVADANKLVANLLARMRVFGCFDEGAESYVGVQPLKALGSAFERAGWHLDSRGHLSPLVLADIEHANLRPALEAQVARLRSASGDPSLLLGTAKELLETVARYTLEEMGQPARANANFDELLHMARERLWLLPQQVSADDAAGKIEREVYEGLWKVAKSVNGLRNLEGTGHGRTSLPTTSPMTARAIVGAAALLGQVMLTKLDETYRARRPTAAALA